MNSLCICKHLTVSQGHLQLSVFAVEFVTQARKVPAAFPMAHGQVVEQIVATSLWRGGGDFSLCEYPFKALDGERAHVLDGVISGHNDIHARHTAHGSDIYYIVLNR